MSPVPQDLPKIFDGTFFDLSLSSIHSDNKVRAKCVACSREISGSLKSTGNFYSHIDKKHPELSIQCRQHSQSRRANAKLKGKPQGRRSFNKITDGKYYVLKKRDSNGAIVTQCQMCRNNIRAHITHKSNLFAHYRSKHAEHLDAFRQHCSANTMERELNDGDEVSVISFSFIFFCFIKSFLTQNIQEVFVEDEELDQFDMTETFHESSVNVSNDESNQSNSIQFKEVDRIADNQGNGLTANRNLPSCERQQFSHLVYASLSQLTDRDALNAMMEMQATLTKYRLAAMPDNWHEMPWNQWVLNK